MKKYYSGLGLISILISLLIAAAVVILAITMYTGGKDTNKSIKQPIERAKSIECLSQIRKIETSIQIYRVEHGQNPQSLEDLTDLREDDFYCPVTHSRYDYNPATGRVTCPDHPRH
ncbi:hypothetical protein BXT86_00920 [candidate division WOR-3 bacterium 4484_100]|uniref:Type II secretion system protein GspG C-terminal domain-containing protein n=1 Tax=candidate division WOR-3 bacterium 4484_100 TaxID=1936077 RepID=A0A1V4QGQ2_UNCW3|nr:MAG: hypothetical protein BXT86_00920 [candidate division WOR-3 bacterium 4484_100]